MTDTHRREHETHAVIGNLRRSHRLMRSLAAAVALAFTMLILAPSVVAARAENEKRNAQVVLQSSDEAELARILRRIDNRIERLERKLARGEDAKNEQTVLRQLDRGLRRLEKTLRRNFERLGRWIDDQGLDPLIAERHQQAGAAFELRLDQLYDKLAALDAGRDNTERLGSARDTLRWLKDHGNRRTPPSFDPTDLPNKAHKADKRNTPRLTPDDFAQTGLHDKAMSALSVGLPLWPGPGTRKA